MADDYNISYSNGAPLIIESPGGKIAHGLTAKNALAMSAVLLLKNSLANKKQK